MKAFVVATMLAACGTSRAAAQADAGVFRLYQGTVEVGRETFSDDGTTLRSTVVIPLAGLKLTSELTWAGGRATRAVLRAFNPQTDSLLRTYTAALSGDTMHVSLTRPRGDTAWAKASSPDAVSGEQSVAGLVMLIERAGRAEREFRIWFPSADSALGMHITFRGDTVDWTVARQHLVAVLGRDGRIQTMAQVGTQVRWERFTGDSLPPLPGLRRPTPDYTAPAGADYTAEDVRVPVRTAAGDTFSLGCTLTKPKTGGPRFPALVTLTGSGLQDRDENLWPLVNAYRLYRQVAERVAAVGIATLRCDDRAFGASTGSADSATMVDFAHDAEARVAWLRARPDIAGDRIAVIGHSEGGIVGPMVAAADPRLRALVIMAGTAKTMLAVVRDQFRYPVEATPGLTPAERDSALAEALRQADAFLSRPLPYLRQARDYDPLPTARRVRQPVLIIQGAVDRQVTAGQADTLGAALRAAGNRDVTVRVFPGLNHLFLPSPSGTGAPSEYAALTDAAVPANVLDTIATWLERRLVR